MAQDESKGTPKELTRLEGALIKLLREEKGDDEDWFNDKWTIRNNLGGLVDAVKSVASDGRYTEEVTGIRKQMVSLYDIDDLSYLRSDIVTWVGKIEGWSRIKPSGITAKWEQDRQKKLQDPETVAAQQGRGLPGADASASTPTMLSTSDRVSSSTSDLGSTRGNASSEAGPSSGMKGKMSSQVIEGLLRLTQYNLRLRNSYELDEKELRQNFHFIKTCMKKIEGIYSNDLNDDSYREALTTIKGLLEDLCKKEEDPGKKEKLQSWKRFIEDHLPAQLAMDKSQWHLPAAAILVVLLGSYSAYLAAEQQPWESISNLKDSAVGCVGVVLAVILLGYIAYQKCSSQSGPSQNTDLQKPQHKV